MIKLRLGRAPGTACLVAVMLAVAWGVVPAATAAPAQEAVLLPPRPPALEEIRQLIYTDESFAEAARRARELMPAYERDYGERSVEVAWLLDLLVQALRKDVHGREEETLLLARRAVEIKEERLGADHLEVTRSLINLGEVHTQRREDEEALRLFEEAVARRERVLPPEHRDVWAARIYVASFHRRRHQFEEARSWYSKALAGLPPAEGPEASRILSDRLLTLRSIALVLQETEAYADALSLYGEILDLLKRLDKELDIASTLSDLALLEDDLGLYGDAERHYMAALEIRRRRLEPDHPYIAQVHNRLGTTYRAVGRYDEALEQFDAAREIYARLGATIDVAMVNHNTAKTLVLMRDYQEAEHLFEQALIVRMKELPDDADVADTREYLGSMLLETGDCDGARGHLEIASRIADQKYDGSPVERARFLLARARLEDLCGDPGRVESLIEEALAAQRGALGDDHPWTAETRRVLASHHARSGDYDRALASQSLAVKGLRNSLPEGHPLLLESLVEEAEMLACSGRREEAFAQALNAGRRLREHVRSAIRVLPARQALRYAGVLASARDLVLSLGVGTPGSPTAARTAWAYLVGSRSLVFEEMTARWAHAQTSESEEVRTLRGDLAASTRRLTELLVRGPAGASLRPYQKLVEDLIRDKERLERELGRASSDFRVEQERRHVGLSDVEAALGDGTSLVAFARYRQIPCLAPEKGEEDILSSRAESEDDRRYVAFVRPAGSADVSLRPLGPAAGIDRNVRDWLREAGQTPPEGVEAARASERRLKEVGARLRERTWDLLGPGVTGAVEAIVVPAGEIHLLSFGALPAPGGGYLVESDPLVRYVSAERDLVKKRRAGRSGTRLLAMGGPDFNEDQPVMRASIEGPSAASGSQEHPTGQRGMERAECPGFRDLVFPPLEQASLEAQEIGRLWQASRSGGPAGTAPAGGTPSSAKEAVVLTGKEATESAFKKWAPGSRIVHVATHAFSLQEACALPDPPGAGGGRRTIPWVSPSKGDLPGWLPADNPLLLSGLAFAGANRRQMSFGESESQDGILTAAEVAAMDLHGVELAVLSACDTGRGLIESGEGVYGLRRAFEVAGAASVVVSLWKVQDRAAREWMNAFYEAGTAGGDALAATVRDVSRALLARQRERKGSGHPYTWGAFVAVGGTE